MDRMVNIFEYHFEESMLEEKEKAEARGKVRAQMQKVMSPRVISEDDIELARARSMDSGAGLTTAHKEFIPPTEITDNEARPFGEIVGPPMGFG